MNRRFLPVFTLGAACLLLPGCAKYTELRERGDAAKKRLDAAAKRLEAARQKRSELEREAGALRQKLDDAAARHSAKRLELQRTLAAADYLKKLSPEALPGWDTENAAAAASLEAAIAAKDASRIGRIVAEATRARRPCVGSPEASEGPECDPEPYVDECAATPQHSDVSPTWKCDPPIVKSEGLPRLVLCTAKVAHPASTDAEQSPWSEQGWETEVTLLRTVFLHDSQLFMADYPDGSPEPVDLYFPRNVGALTACRAANDHNACTHRCDVEFGRWQNPCEPHCDGCGDSGDGPDGYYEQEGEDASVRAARLEAERMEAEAREAEQRAREAREEVRYQECLAGCEPPTPDEPTAAEGSDAPPPPPDPDRAEARRRFLRPVAPGVLLVEDDLVHFAGTRPLKVSTSTLLLQNDALAGLFEKGSTGRGGLERLRLLAEVQDSRAPEAAKRLGIADPHDQGPPYVVAKLAGRTVFAGVLFDGTPAAFQLSAEKGTAPARPVDRADLCSAVAAKADDFGSASSALAGACDFAAKADAEEAALRASLAAVDGGEALKAWKSNLDAAARALTPSQKYKLDAELAKRKAELGKAEAEQHKARLATLEYKDAKDFKAAVDASFVLDATQKREVTTAFDKRKPVLAKAQLEALLSLLSAAEARAALDQAKADLDAATLLDGNDKRKVEKALEKRRAELKKACKLDGADACPAAAADAGGAP